MTHAETLAAAQVAADVADASAKLDVLNEDVPVSGIDCGVQTMLRADQSLICGALSGPM